MATCSSCDAEIEWAYTKNDKRIPLDLGAQPGGNLIVTHKRASEHGMTPVVEYVAKGTGDRVTHFATCPNARGHRRE